MVKPVSTSDVRSRLQSVAADVNTTKNAAPGPVARGPGVAGAKDEVGLSKAAAAVTASVEAGPPFDIETVSRIKTAIQEGKYPVNVDAITDSLFESYRELMAH